MRCNTYFSLSAQSLDDGTELGRRRHCRRTLVNLFRARALADTVELPGIRRDRRSLDVMLFDRRGKKKKLYLAMYYVRCRQWRRSWRVWAGS